MTSPPPNLAYGLAKGGGRPAFAGADAPDPNRKNGVTAAGNPDRQTRHRRVLMPGGLNGIS